MLKNKSFFIFFALSLVMLMSVNNTVQAQDGVSFQNKLKSILSNFNNFRFSSISFYEINDKQVRSLKEIIKKKMDFEEEAVEEETTFNQDVVDTARMNLLVSEIKKLMATGDRSLPAIRKAFNGDKENFEYLEDLEVNDVELKLAFQQALGTKKSKSDIYQMFLVTMPVKDPATPPDIIGLILCKERIDKDEYEEYLISYYNQAIGNAISNEKNILTYPELMNFVIDEGDEDTKSSNLYDKLIVEFRQGNCQLITPEVRGIGSELVFVKNYGKTTSIITNDNDITDSDVSKFIRISDGQPTDYWKENELLISPDLISWKKYTTEYYEYEDEEGNIKTEPYDYANSNLPSYGAEIRYGIDEINYPSFWSERLAVRAIWDNLKFGVILPTNGWSSLTSDLFDIDRTMTHAGFGVSVNADFPVKIIPQSGVFSFGGSYVFGDAKESTYKNRQKLIDNNEYVYYYNSVLCNDYLVRYTGQLHYTFGVNIDDGYQMRFGIGGTVYSMESWRNKQEVNDEGEEVWNFIHERDDVIGGISMKAEYMASSVTTPYGISVQYFDESLACNAWLQIPVVTNTFFVRLDAKGFVAAFKDEPRPWEKRSLFMPMVRLIFNL